MKGLLKSVTKNSIIIDHYYNEFTWLSAYINKQNRGVPIVSANYISYNYICRLVKKYVYKCMCES